MCFPSFAITKQRDTIQPIIHVTNIENEAISWVYIMVGLILILGGGYFGISCRKCLKKIPIIGRFF